MTSHVDRPPRRNCPRLKQCQDPPTQIHRLTNSRRTGVTHVSVNEPAEAPTHTGDDVGQRFRRPSGPGSRPSALTAATERCRRGRRDADDKRAGTRSPDGRAVVGSDAAAAVARPEPTRWSPDGGRCRAPSRRRRHSCRGGA